MMNKEINKKALETGELEQINGGAGGVHNMTQLNLYMYPVFKSGIDKIDEETETAIEFVEDDYFLEPPQNHWEIYFT